MSGPANCIEMRAEELANYSINLFQMRLVVDWRLGSYLYQTRIWQEPGELARAFERMNRISLRHQDEGRTLHSRQTLAFIVKTPRGRQTSQSDNRGLADLRIIEHRLHLSTQALRCVGTDCLDRPKIVALLERPQCRRSPILSSQQISNQSIGLSGLEAHGSIGPGRPAKDERADAFRTLDRQPESGSRSHGDTSDNRIFKFQVVEKGREIAFQRCNGEVFRAPELALSVTAKIGVENVQCSGRDAGTLRNQEATRLPEISADAVLKDHRIRRAPLRIAGDIMQANMIALIERHTKHHRNAGLSARIDSRTKATEAGTCFSSNPCKTSGRRLWFAAAARAAGVAASAAT